jgi:hypothetical protein
MTTDYTFGPVDPLAAAFRYTTLADVKQRLGIDHLEYDDQLTTANQAAETAIDQTLGRSFPDTGDNPEVDGVPAAVQSWALDATIALWKAADAPFGQAGSDTWLGSIDIIGETERVMRRHPGAYGYKVSWGVA